MPLGEQLKGFWSLAWNERAKLARATAAHLDLVLEALFLAVLIGVPLGILASRSRRAGQVVLGLANVFQTIPSLALLGLLLIAFQGAIGKPPALTALIVYSLLPIIKNTLLGLQNVDAGVNEAAVGMGMTSWQRLRLVELPLAVPILLGGVRVATVAAVGMATIAATIGAEGLGKYITRGISSSNLKMILLGSIPAGLLALACDAALGEVENALDPSQPKRSKGRTRLALTAVLGLLLLGLWGAWESQRSLVSGGKTRIVIGSKDSAEMIILGHMLADLVEAETDFEVVRKLNLGGTMVCYNALKRGGLDAYVEYTGTALTSLLNQPPDNDPARVRDTVREQMARRDDVAVLDPFGFENTFAILMRRSEADRLKIKTISDAARHADTLRSGFGPEFMNRPDGFPGLIKAYGLNFAEPPREMDRNLLYQAVARGSLDIAAGDSTDGRIAVNNLVSLEDDRRYFPPYEALPLVNGKTLRKHPQLRNALNRLAGQINADTMRGLNYEADGKQRDPDVVAREFLIARGLIAK